MPKKIIYLLGIVLTIIIGTFLYSIYCCNAKKDVSAIETENLPPNYNEINANKSLCFNFNDFKFKCLDSFKFNKDGFNALLPISDSIDIGINALKQYMDKNPDIELQIKGYGMKSEQNSSPFNNLGLARANDVMNYFISKGVDPARIKTSGELCGFLFIDNKIVSGSINFKIAVSDNFAKLKADYNVNPITVLFKYNKYETSLSSENLEKLTNLVAALKKYNDSELIIIGHTDNTGRNAKNMILGTNRANYLKATLVKNGYPEERIKTISKGEEEPVTDNNTEQGRSQNRRAIINIK